MLTSTCIAGHINEPYNLPVSGYRTLQIRQGVLTVVEDVIEQSSTAKRTCAKLNESGEWCGLPVTIKA